MVDKLYSAQTIYPPASGPFQKSLRVRREAQKEPLAPLACFFPREEGTARVNAREFHKLTYTQKRDQSTDPKNSHTVLQEANCAETKKQMPLVQIAPTRAPGSGLPVVLVDSTALPPGQLPSDAQILEAVDLLPQTDHEVIFFASGAPKTPNMPWLLNSYRLLSREAKKRVQKVYMVHERWWVKTFTSLLGNVVSPKFQRKITHISNLSELAKHIDITVLNINPRVYLYDQTLQPIIAVPKHIEPVFGLHADHPRGNMVYEHCIRYLKSIPAEDLSQDAFAHSTRSPVSRVLIQAVSRGQMLNLQDYGPHNVIALVKFYLFELRHPVINPQILVDHQDNRHGALRSLTPASHATLTHCVSWLNQLHKEGFSTQVMVTELMPYLTQRVDGEIPFHELQFLHMLIEDWPLHQPQQPVRMKADNVPKLPARPVSPVSVSPTSSIRSRSISPKRGKALQELPLPNSNRVLRPKASLANIRGARIAEIVKTYEERLDDMDTGC